MAAVIPYVIQAVVAWAVGYAINYFWGPKPKIFSPKFDDNQASVRSAVEPHKVIYGEAMAGGPIVFADVGGEGNKTLHTIVVLAGHEVDSIGDVYFDDVKSSDDFYTRTHIVDLGIHVSCYGVDAYGATFSVTINGVTFSNTVSGTTVCDFGTSFDSIYSQITTHAGYAAQNYTAAVIQESMTIRLTAKSPNSNFTVTSTSSDSFVANVNVIVIQEGSQFSLTKYLGTSTQTADAALVAALPTKWTTDHRLRGRAYIYAALHYNENRWPTGIPNIRAIVKGKKLYDPRTTLTVWSDNPALCVRDYLTSTAYGMSATTAEIDDTSFIAAANVCDELVFAKPTTAITSSTAGNPASFLSTAHGLRSGDSAVIAGHSQASANATWTITRTDANNFTIPLNLATGGTGGTIQLQQKRYTCNGIVNTGDQPTDIIGKILTSMNGSLVYAEGKYSVKAAAYSAPVMDLDESDLRDSIKVQASTPRKQLFNAVKGTCINKFDHWREMDFPPMTNATYETEDGGARITKDIVLPFTNDPYRAERLAKIVLERSRQDISVSFPAKIPAYKLKVNETIRLTIAYLGWTNKQFVVVEWNYKDRGVDLVLREEASASYDWNSGNATLVDPAPNTTLPSSLTALPITGLVLRSGTEQLYKRADGTIFSRIKASWTAPNDIYVKSGGHYEIEFTEASTGLWQRAPDAIGGDTSIYILDVRDTVEYVVRVRSVNTIGIKSDWVALGHVVVGKTARPSNVTGFSVTQNGNVVVFQWTQVTDLDYSGSEIRYNPKGITSWDNGTPVTRVTKGTQITTAAVPPGDWTFLIKAVDTSGNYSATAATYDKLITTDFDVILQSEQSPSWLGVISAVGDQILLEDGTDLLLLDDGDLAMLESATSTFVRHWTGALIPESTALASAHTNAQLFEQFVPFPQATCIYEAQQFDLSFDGPSRVWGDIQSELGRGATGIADPDLQIDYRTAAGTYDGFEYWSIGTVTARYVKHRLILTTSEGKAKITGFLPTADAEERTETQTVTVGATGTAVTFLQAFHVIPSVSAFNTGSTPLIATITGITTTNCVVHLFNSSGVEVGGTARVEATGV